MPKFGQFKFGQERFGKTHKIRHLGKFGTFKFGNQRFGDDTSPFFHLPTYKGYSVGPKARRGLAKEVIFRIRYGKKEQYAWFKPENPQTPTQQAHRQEYKNAYLAWQVLTPGQKENWQKKALGTGMSGYNLFMKTEMLK